MRLTGQDAVQLGGITDTSPLARLRHQAAAPARRRSSRCPRGAVVRAAKEGVPPIMVNSCSGKASARRRQQLVREAQGGMRIDRACMLS